MQTVLLNKEVYDITFKKSSSIVVFTSVFQVEFIHHEVVTVGQHVCDFDSADVNLIFKKMPWKCHSFKVYDM